MFSSYEMQQKNSHSWHYIHWTRGETFDCVNHVIPRICDTGVHSLFYERDVFLESFPLHKNVFQINDKLIFKQ